MRHGKHLKRNSIYIKENQRSLYKNCFNTHTHTHTHIYIYIYIYRERERERTSSWYNGLQAKLSDEFVKLVQRIIHFHYHQGVRTVRISWTLSLSLSLSLSSLFSLSLSFSHIYIFCSLACRPPWLVITLGYSSRRQLVSTQSWWT